MDYAKHSITRMKILSKTKWFQCQNCSRSHVIFYMDTTCTSCCLPHVCCSFHFPSLLIPPYLCIYSHSNPTRTTLPCNTCLIKVFNQLVSQLCRKYIIAELILLCKTLSPEGYFLKPFISL